MPAAKILKLHHSIPFQLESRLIHFFGYAIQGRQYKESITFIRNPPKGDVIVVGDKAGPTNGRKQALETRCDNIVAMFPDPYSAVNAVRTRLHNMAQSLVEMKERQFVVEYMAENFPVGLEDK